MSDAACVASVGNLPGESLADADDNILGVYQDLLHHNTEMHMDGGIEEDIKWQERWKTVYYAHPTVRSTVWSNSKSICWNS